MNTKIAQNIIHILIVFIFMLSLAWMPNASARAWTSPTFMLNINNDSSWHGLDAWSWPLGSQVTLMVNDPNTPQNPDYIEVQRMGAPTPGQGTISHALFMQDGSFQGHPGFTITLSDGIQTKSMIVPLLIVTEYDVASDKITGKSDPSITIDVPTCANEDCSEMVEHYITADNNGNWTADFSGVYDLKPGDSVEPQYFDDDWDHVVLRDWRLPNPRIFALLGDQRVHAWGWIAGTLLTLTIDNPATPQSPDYIGTQVATAFEDWDHGAEWSTTCNIQPGYRITVSGGGITKELLVAPLTVTVVDMDTDTVSGKGDPGFEIHVGLLCDDYVCTSRNIFVDSNGNWLADFSVPGNKESEIVFDIRLGSGTGVYEIDEDGDATNVGWEIPNHTFNVRANDDRIEGSEWVLGSTITIEIDDPNTQTSPDYADTTTVGLADWDPSQTYFGITANDYDLKLGDIVTVTDGDITKQLTLSSFKIIDVNLNSDMVYGIANPGQRVNIWTCWQSDPCVNRDETADGDGNWATNFAVPGEQDWEQETSDLRAGSWIDSSVSDEDGDSTLFGWSVSIGWTLKGFYQPVDMNGVYNTVKNGSTVPFKFEVFAGSIELTDIANIESFTYTQIACDTSASTDSIETTVTGDNSLRYDPQAGQFIYNWKTPKAIGKCYRVSLVTLDGSSLVAYFKLK